MRDLWLDFNKTLKVVQVCSPTTATDDDVVEGFCDELRSTLVIKSTYTVVMGGLNAAGKTAERHIGRHGIGVRNDKLVDWLK